MLYRNLGLPQGPFTLKSIRMPSNTYSVVLLRRIPTSSLRVHRAFCLPCTSNCNCPKSSFSYSPRRLTMGLVGPITALQHADRLGDSPAVLSFRIRALRRRSSSSASSFGLYCQSKLSVSATVNSPTSESSWFTRSSHHRRTPPASLSVVLVSGKLT